MAQFRNFEDMHVWQESRTLIESIREICKRSHVKRDYPFVDQITRAARSISANIAEGSDCLNNGEFIQFLGYSKRSAAEVRSHLYDAFYEKYISVEEFRELTTQCTKIGRMIAKLIHHLQSLDPDLKRTYRSIESIPSNK